MNHIFGITSIFSRLAKAVPRAARLARPGLTIFSVMVGLVVAACSSAATTPAQTIADAPESPPLPEAASAPTLAPTTSTSGGSDLSPSELMPPDEEPVLSILERLNPNGPKKIDAREYVQLLNQDAIKPIYTPIINTPDELDLDSKELVIGVSINGDSRAYPLRILRFREMANDELGGTPILITW